ncbi:MAG TPA: PDGLE domain-containing protein [Phycisphaerae bacterium]|nr:PDGLE domain-containing protein [Phycisphaerae bacterium]
MSPYNRNTLLVGILVVVVIGGVLSYFASGDPDGLEKTQEILGAAEPVHTGVEPPPSVFEGYSLKCLGEGFWGNAVAGVVGSLFVLGGLLVVARILKRRPSRQDPEKV